MELASFSEGVSYKILSTSGLFMLRAVSKATELCFISHHCYVVLWSDNGSSNSSLQTSFR